MPTPLSRNTVSHGWHLALYKARVCPISIPLILHLTIRLAYTARTTSNPPRPHQRGRIRAMPQRIKSSREISIMKRSTLLALTFTSFMNTFFLALTSVREVGNSLRKPSIFWNTYGQRNGITVSKPMHLILLRIVSFCSGRNKTMPCSLWKTGCLLIPPGNRCFLRPASRL